MRAFNTMVIRQDPLLWLTVILFAIASTTSARAADPDMQRTKIGLWKCEVPRSGWGKPYACPPIRYDARNMDFTFAGTPDVIFNPDSSLGALGIGFTWEAQLAAVTPADFTLTITLYPYFPTNKAPNNAGTPPSSLTIEGNWVAVGSVK